MINSYFSRLASRYVVSSTFIFNVVGSSFLLVSYKSEFAQSRERRLFTIYRAQGEFIMFTDSCWFFSSHRLHVFRFAAMDHGIFKPSITPFRTRYSYDEFILWTDSFFVFTLGLDNFAILLIPPVAVNPAAPHIVDSVL